MEHYQLYRLYELDSKVKEILGLPWNSTIQFDRHPRPRVNREGYWYAYMWVPELQKLKKKYIGKELPVLVLPPRLACSG